MRPDLHSRSGAPTEDSGDKDQICVLVIDDQEPVRYVCGQVVEFLGHRFLAADSINQALLIMEREPVDIVIADVEIITGGPQMRPTMLPQTLNDLKINNPRVEIAVMTPSSGVPKAVQALNFGASEYIVKPFTTEEIRAVIQRLAQTLDLKDENRFLRERLQERDHFGPLVGQSPPMQQVFKIIQKVAQTRSPVLILGESGTGKELVAHSIHDVGPWREKPFAPVDCGSLAPTLIESELFGHVRGAFTGANTSKEGLLESARDGTLFFDEIGELPIELQTRLLRTIQEKEFRPVGGTQRVPFDARIIAATNRDLKSAVEQGTFRKDLYFRLNVVSIKLPPLRERRSDIPLLTERILQKFALSEPGQRVKAPWLLSSEALDRLLAHNWPGNVRELENALERAVTLSSGPLILAKDLPSSLQMLLPSPEHAAPDADPQSVIPLEEMERQAIERALDATGGDKIRAARLLGIGKTTLYRKLIKYQKNGG